MNLPIAVTATDVTAALGPAEVAQIGQGFVTCFERMRALVAAIEAQKQRLGQGAERAWIPDQFAGDMASSMKAVYALGKAWSAEVIRTRAIPPKQHKALEMAVRLFARKDWPKDKLKWFATNDKRLALLAEATSWP
mgnify:FL=1